MLEDLIKRIKQLEQKELTVFFMVTASVVRLLDSAFRLLD